jgi:uncharacterized protein (TIGR03437 family)
MVLLPGTNLGDIYAQADENAIWPINLGGIRVNVAGRSAPVIAVTQAPGFTLNNPVYRVDFAVPPNGPIGNGIMITVTHVPSGSGAWSAPAEVRVMPSFWSTNGTSTGTALAQDADTFVAITPERPALASGQTRVVLYATSLRSLVITNSLVVRARTGDGRVFILPLDYAGAGKIMPGLDQIIVR